MEIVRTGSYTKALKRLKKLGASDADITAMENEIAANPEGGDVIEGCGGIRKVRFGYGNLGKSGGGRAIYIAITLEDTVILLTAYAKADQKDLTAEEKKLLKKLAKQLTEELSK